jgi:Tfp pilus assembly protein PilO
MFEQYSYKIKFKFLLIFFVILSIAAYRRSFSSLIDVVKENKLLTSKIETMGKKTQNIAQLKSEIARLDKMIGKEGIGKEKVQQGIVSFLLENSSGVSISDMQSIHEVEDTNYKVYTYQIDLVGNFNQLVQLVYVFEKNFDYSKMVSIKFYMDKKNNKNEVLHLKILFQNYENNK